MPSEPLPSPLQHVIPQHYLKGFADSEMRTHVWVYNKGQAYSTGNEINRRNPFRQAIRSAGAIPGAYQFVTLTGAHLDADPPITQQEAWGVEVLRKLRARASISVDDKVRFSMYIDLMRRRVPAGTHRALPFIRRAMNTTFDWHLVQRTAAQAGRFDLAMRFDPRVPENVAAMEQEMALRGVPQRSFAIVKQVGTMRWLFFTVNGDRFFPTTDNPAFFPPGLGLTNGNGFVMMPIDSQMVLLVRNAPADDRVYVPATSEQYALFCKVILSGATDKAFSCRNDTNILDTLNNPRLPGPDAGHHARNEHPPETEQGD